MQGLVIYKDFQDLITIHTVFNICLILCYQATGRLGQAAIYSVGWDTITDKGLGSVTKNHAKEEYDTMCTV